MAHDFGIDTTPRPVAAHDDAGHVVYLRSLTKSVSPALRVAAVIARGPARDRILNDRAAESMYVSGLLQQAALEVVSDPGWRTHLRRLRTQLRARRDLLVESLREHAPSVAVDVVPPGGLHVWARLPRRHRRRAARPRLAPPTGSGSPGRRVVPGGAVGAVPAAVVHRGGAGRLPGRRAGGRAGARCAGAVAGVLRPHGVPTARSGGVGPRPPEPAQPAVGGPGVPGCSPSSTRRAGGRPRPSPWVHRGEPARHSWTADRRLRRLGRAGTHSSAPGRRDAMRPQYPGYRPCTPSARSTTRTGVRVAAGSAPMYDSRRYGADGSAGNHSSPRRPRPRRRRSRGRAARRRCRRAAAPRRAARPAGRRPPRPRGRARAGSRPAGPGGRGAGCGGGAGGCASRGR
ncbi:aminotransferase class I/II-fold pyridoxal phosphate-dependent enzyme [Pimelobacter simplex]|uniref:aminotransferase class I/II-fold pyridoxal phosphate-dependent enzyme n=1 Tax=Nocardioides simplex TaxID=2045 RepID=UPI00345D5236